MIPCSRILHKQLVVYFADAQPDGRDVAVLTTFSPRHKGSVRDQQKYSANLPLGCHQTHSGHIFQISKGRQKSENVLLPKNLNNYCYSIWAKKMHFCNPQNCLIYRYVFSNVLANLKKSGHRSHSRFEHVCLPAALWHPPSPIQCRRKLNLLQTETMCNFREGGRKWTKRGWREGRRVVRKTEWGREGGREREREREMGGEQRSWKAREGLEKGQGEKKRRGRRREGPCVLLKVSFVAEANC